MMSAREILENCRATALELEKLDDQLGHVLPTGKPPGVKVQQYDATPHGTNDPTTAAIQLYDGLIEQRAKLYDQYCRQVKSAKQIILSVQRSRLSIILLRYYIEGQTDQEIADDLELSREYVNKLRNGALNDL